MPDPTLEQMGFPVSQEGHVVASYATGSRTVVGSLPPGYVPVNEDGEMLINLQTQTPTYETDVLYIDPTAEATPSDAGAMYYNTETITTGYTVAASRLLITGVKTI